MAQINSVSLARHVEIYRDVSADNKSSFMGALLNLTGIYTLYSFGADLAHRSRIDRSIEALNGKDDVASTTLKDGFEQQKGKNTSNLVAKTGYLFFSSLAGSGAAIGSRTLLGTGLSGAILFAGYSMLKAGYDAYDRSADRNIQFIKQIEQ